MSVQTSTASGRDRRRAGGLSVLLALVALAPAAPSTALAAGLSATAMQGGSARAPSRDDAPRRLAERQISMDEAVDMAQRRYNARVVRAEVSDRGGRRVYLLRLLSDDGRVFNVRVDAATGNIQ
jgi:uncharacterized membrane protein YkoI